MAYDIIAGYDIVADLPHEAHGETGLATRGESGAAKFGKKNGMGKAITHGPHGSLVQDHGLQVMRRQEAPLPLLPAIPAGGAQTYNIQSQRAFRADRLFLTDSVGPASVAVVQDINIAQRSQFVSPGAVPISRFAGNFFDGHIRFETSYPGIFISINVLNLNLVPDLVVGSMTGESVIV